MSRIANVTRLLVLSALLTALVATGALAQEDAPFTVQSEEAAKPALEALYAAMYDGAAPAYVDGDADLFAVTEEGVMTMSDEEIAAVGMPTDFVYHLYDAALLLLTENEDAAAFMDFAISPDGQQALIDAGFLPETVTVTDQGGNEVEIAQPVSRLLAPYSMGTYYVYGVGAEDRIVAGNFLGWRGPAGETMTRIDPNFPNISDVLEMNQSEINIEEAVALEPDVILASTRTAWIEPIHELGIPLVLYEGESHEALKEAMLLTGSYLGPDATRRAEEWVNYYDWVLEAVADAIADIPEEEHVTVLFTGTEPLRVASGDMYQSAMIEAAGGVSVSAELEGYWNDVNLEQVLVWDPDVIFVPPYGGASVEAITESEEWQVLDAVKEGRVYQISQFGAPLDTPIPDSVLGIVIVANRLYPEQVGDMLDCSYEATYFYNMWYGYDISEEEVATLCGTE